MAYADAERVCASQLVASECNGDDLPPFFARTARLDNRKPSPVLKRCWGHRTPNVSRGSHAIVTRASVWSGAFTAAFARTLGYVPTDTRLQARVVALAFIICSPGFGRSREALLLPLPGASKEESKLKIKLRLTISFRGGIVFSFTSSSRMHKSDCRHALKEMLRFRPAFRLPPPNPA